jgi:NAD(P)-dependent dehydrogenase (short-subunit alcohol dehydrogenase family)
MGEIFRNKFSLPSLPPKGSFSGQTILITGATSGLGFATAIRTLFFLLVTIQLSLEQESRQSGKNENHFGLYTQGFIPHPPLIFSQNTLYPSSNILTCVPDFVNLGATSVIITGRTLARAQAAAEAISKVTGKPGIIRCYELDMSTIAGTKRFVEKLTVLENEIEVIVLNAGCYTTKFTASPDGYEETLQVNVLSTSLLAVLLLPWLDDRSKQYPKPGVVPHMTIVTSGVHREVPLSVLPKKDILSFYSKPENYPKPKIDIYYISKLLLQYCVREVAEMATNTKTNVVVNPVCPGKPSLSSSFPPPLLSPRNHTCHYENINNLSYVGMVKSNLARHHKTNAAIGVVADIFMTLCCKTAAGAARTVIHAALTKPEENGLYVTHTESDEDYKK